MEDLLFLTSLTLEAARTICVTRVRFVSASHADLFALKLILLEGPMNAFQDGKKWEATQFPSICDTAVGMGLYEIAAKYLESLDDAIRMHSTSAGSRWIHFSLYQARADLKPVNEKHQVFLYSNIQESSTAALKKRYWHSTNSIYLMGMVASFFETIHYL